MQYNPERLRQLFHQYLNDSLSDENRLELMQMIEENKHSTSVQEMIAEELSTYNTNATEYSETINAERANELFSQILSKRQVQPAIPHYNSGKSWIKWAAAAAIVIAIAGVGYQYLQQTNDTKNAIAKTDNPYPYDIPPGKKNATLTLSDGTRINLDSTANGRLAKEGATSITKQNDQLSYDYAGGLTNVQFNNIATARGNQYMVVLPDGTKVWLNASSSITFPTAFTENERRVKISGEAYFEVAKKANMPFIVSFSGDGEIEVLGTHFNVNTYNDDAVLRTTLLEGSVRISKNKATGILKPGQQAQLKDNASMKITEADTDEVMAWKNGFFSFKDATTQAIMLQLSRWYDIDINFEGPTGKQLFTGEIDRSLSLISVLKILEKTKVHFRLEQNRKLVILP